jgi:hypothetical protein
VLKTAKKIAVESGKDLAELIHDIRQKNFRIKVRLVGHSLGCDVVKSAFDNLGFDVVESTHLFGSPVEEEDLKSWTKFIGTFNITNYYNPTDDVIKEGVEKGDLKKPTCLHRVELFDFTRNVVSKRLYAKNHGMKAQMKALRSFP